MKIISQKDAKILGLRRYYTGKMCKNGHLSERRTTSGHCLSCLCISRRKCYVNNKERKLEYGRLWQKKNPEAVARKSKKWRTNQLDKNPNYYKDQRKNKIEKCPEYVIVLRERGKQWRKRNLIMVVIGKKKILIGLGNIAEPDKPLDEKQHPNG